MDYSDFITSTLLEAAKIANKNFGKVNGIIKNNDNNQVLTETDLEIGKYFIDQVKKHYPNTNIIDEETGVFDCKSNLTWMVDPIDGTSNFANGLPMFGIMIGLLKDNQPITGGVMLPAFDEIYYAEKNKGAFCNGQKIVVTKEKNLQNLLVNYMIDGHSENPQLTKKECNLLSEIIIKIRNLRTSNSCFDLMMTAKGKYGASLNRTSKVWDNVAPQIIIEEAGGKYTDFIGRPIKYNYSLEELAKQSFTFCSASSIIHQQLQQLIAKYNFYN